MFALAPLALLALEKERFLACGVINLVAASMHPMGLFLPPALVINTLLRRKRLFAGLFAASVPVVLYGPWLAHVWANRAFLPDNRTGGDVSLGGVGGGANLGLFLAPLAALAIPWLIVRRGPALGLLGALLGFVVVFPMGFGSRFLAFNIHWPLACLAGYALGETLAWLELRPRLRLVAHTLTLVVLTTALLAYPAITLSLGPPVFGGSRGTRLQMQLQAMLSNWQVSVQSAALPKLFDSYSGGGMGGGMGPPGMGPPGMGPPGMGPGMGPPGMRSSMGPSMGPGMGPGMGQGMAARGTGLGMGPPGLQLGMTPPGMQPAVGPGMAAQGMRPGRGPDMAMPGRKVDPQARPDRSEPTGERSKPDSARRGDSRSSERPRRNMGMGQGGGGGMPGMNAIRRTGAQDFFEAVRTQVPAGDIIHINDGMTANWITGETGRWTTSGILRDVRSDQPRARPEECDFAATFGMGMGMGMPGPGSPMGSAAIPSNFEKVFENEFGTLYRNPTKVEHDRQPLAADVSLPALIAIASVCFLLVLSDFFFSSRPRVLLVAAALGTLAVAICLWPLASTAISELRDPPAAPSGPPDGPPGFGGPGFGGPGFGPGAFLGEAFLRPADADKSGAVSLQEFKALAARWWDAWETSHDGSVSPEEFSQGLQSVLGPPPGMPMPQGPGGFGPAMFLAPGLFSACDANADGKLTRDEMVGAFEKWFQEWSAGAQGDLDAAALGSGLQRVIGPPPGF